MKLAMLFGAILLKYCAIFALLWTTDITRAMNEPSPNNYEQRLATVVAKFHSTNAEPGPEGQWITIEVFDRLEKALSTVLQNLSDHFEPLMELTSMTIEYDKQYIAAICSLTPRCLDFVHVFGSNGRARSETLRLYMLYEWLCLNLPDWADVQSTADDESDSPSETQQGSAGNVTDGRPDPLDRPTEDAAIVFTDEIHGSTSAREGNNDSKHTDVEFVTEAFVAVNGVDKSRLLVWSWDSRDNVWESLSEAAILEANSALLAVMDGAAQGENAANAAAAAVTATWTIANSSIKTTDKALKAWEALAKTMSTVLNDVVDRGVAAAVTTTDTAAESTTLPVVAAAKTTNVETLMVSEMMVTATDLGTTASKTIEVIMQRALEAMESAKKIMEASKNMVTVMTAASAVIAMDSDDHKEIDIEIGKLNSNLEIATVSVQPTADGVADILAVGFRILESEFSREVMKMVNDEATTNDKKNLFVALSNLSDKFCQFTPPVLAYLSRMCRADSSLKISELFGIYLTICADWESFLDVHCPTILSNEQPNAKQQWRACAGSAIADRLLVNHYSVFKNLSDPVLLGEPESLSPNEVLDYLIAVHDIVHQLYGGDSPVSTPGPVWTTSDRLTARQALSQLHAEFDGAVYPLQNRETTIDGSISFNISGMYRWLVPWRADISAVLNFHDLINEHANAVIDDHLLLHALTIELYLTKFDLSSANDSQLQRLRESIRWYTDGGQKFRVYLGQPGIVKSFPNTVKEVINAIQGLNRNKSTAIVLRSKVRHALVNVPDWPPLNDVDNVMRMNDMAVCYCQRAEYFINSFLDYDYSITSGKQFRLECNKYVSEVFVELGRVDESSSDILVMADEFSTNILLNDDELSPATPVTVGESSTTIPVIVDQSSTTNPGSVDKTSTDDKPVDTEMAD